MSHLFDELRTISTEKHAVGLATRDGGIDSFDAMHLHYMLERRRQAARDVARKPIFMAGDRVVHVTRGEAVVTGVTYGDWSDSTPIYRILQGEVYDMWPAESIA
jgi:hypothetical protein